MCPNSHLLKMPRTQGYSVAISLVHKNSGMETWPLKNILIDVLAATVTFVKWLPWQPRLNKKIIHGGCTENRPENSTFVNFYYLLKTSRRGIYYYSAVLSVALVYNSARVPIPRAFQ